MGTPLCRRMAQLTDQLGYLTETTLRKLAGDQWEEPVPKCIAHVAFSLSAHQSRVCPQCRHHCSRLGLDNTILHALNGLSAAAERFGPLSVEHKHIFSIHGLAPLLLTPDILVSPLCLIWAALHCSDHCRMSPTLGVTFAAFACLRPLH